MKGENKPIGLVVKYCLITGLPAEKSEFNNALRAISPDLADIMTKEVEYV